MRSPSFPAGTSADRYGSNWTPTYRHRTWRAIKKRAAQVTRVIFGCSHRNVTPVTDQRQNCLDCTAWREVLPATITAAAYTSRWRTRDPRPESDGGRLAASFGFPSTLREFIDDPERGAAWIRLMFAAKRLAESQVARRRGWNPDELHCERCGFLEAHGGRHLDLCDVGAILSSLAVLENLTRKEDAEEEDGAPAMGFAGDSKPDFVTRAGTRIFIPAPVDETPAVAGRVFAARPNGGAR